MSSALLKREGKHYELRVVLPTLSLDISMPDMGGTEVAAQMRKAGCEAKIVFLSVYGDPDFVEAAMSAALAYVVKPRLATDLLPALRNALEGRTFTSPSVHLPQNPGYAGPHS